MSGRGRVLVVAMALSACKAAPRQEHAGAQELGQAQHAAGPTASHVGHAPAGASSDAAAIPTGYAAVTLDRTRPGGLNLTTARAEERDLVRAVRTTGVVTVDETRTSHVHSKIRGWVTSIQASFVGKAVRVGEPLCTVYSQEVFAAEAEYVAVVERASKRTSASPGAFADAERAAQEQLLASARRRLALWDVPEAELERLARTREPSRTFPLLAPRTGTVVAKLALDGMYIEPSAELFTVSDLTRVWVLADVYESDIPLVHVGTPAKLAIEGRGEALESRIAFLPPSIDEATRTLKVRFELDNRAGQLRVGAFVQVDIDARIGSGLAVPEDAVLRTGTRAVVFVVHEDHVIPTEVTLGPLVGGFYRVDGALSPGTQVATGAQFLLDSESRLRASSAAGGGREHAH